LEDRVDCVLSQEFTGGDNGNSNNTSVISLGPVQPSSKGNDPKNSNEIG
jgi:hypothetical protein